MRRLQWRPTAPSSIAPLSIATAVVLVLAFGGPGAAVGHDRDPADSRDGPRDSGPRDTGSHDAGSRDNGRDRDAQDRDSKATDATAQSGSSGSDPSGSISSKSSDSDSGSGSSGSGSTSGGSSGSSGSGSTSGSSGSSGSGSTSGSSGSSGSGSTSGSSGSSGSGSTSGSSSGSSGSGSGDEDDDDGDDNQSGGDVQTAGHRVDVETDSQGRERRRGEFLVRGERGLAEALKTAGFVTLSSRHLANLNATLFRVRVRDNSTIDADISYARRIAGTEEAEPNYVFRLSGGTASRAMPAAVASAAATPSPAGAQGPRVGVVDTGADPRTPALRDRIAITRGFGGGPYTARAHGTYIAQILTREGVRVEVADVFQADAQGAPVATAESISRGIDWLAARGLPVINVSITGPNSGVLSAVVARAIARGSIVIAAAGNNGPAAPPVYPAAFPNVVGVTAVDTGGHIYRRANRGDYVDFAALGVRVPVAGAGGATEYVSGTSYAAPSIAAAFARGYTQAKPGEAGAQIQRMQNTAIDLGPRGRDPVFGWGRLASVPPPH